MREKLTTSQRSMLERLSVSPMARIDRAGETANQLCAAGYAEWGARALGHAKWLHITPVGIAALSSAEQVEGKVPGTPKNHPRRAGK